jgi:hypothetical protein
MRFSDRLLEMAEAVRTVPTDSTESIEVYLLLLLGCEFMCNGWKGLIRRHFLPVAAGYMLSVSHG